MGDSLDCVICAGEIEQDAEIVWVTAETDKTSMGDRIKIGDWPVHADCLERKEKRTHFGH